MSNDSSKPAELSTSKDLGSPFLIIFLTLVLFIVSQVIGAALVQLALSIMRSSANIDTSAAAEFFYVLFAEGLAAVFTVYLVRSRKLPLKFIGLGRRLKADDFTKAILGFVVYYFLLLVVVSIIGHFYPDLNKGSQDVGFNDLNTGIDTALAFCALVIFPPIGEEILVRGYLFSGLRSRLRFLPAMLITSLLFGAAHLQSNGANGVLWAAGLNTFILSLVLVKLRESTGALYAGMMVHCANNLIAFGFHFHI